MISGSNTNKGTGYATYVGLGVVRPLMVNPSNEDYKRITGREMPFALTYDPVKNSDGEVSFPASILVENQETSQYDMIKFYLSDREVTSKSGKFRFINAVGNYAWADSPEALKDNPKMKWFTSYSYAPVTGGFEQLFNFLQALTCYDAKSDEANWVKDMASAGITPGKIYLQGDVSGLNSLITWANNMDHSCTVLYTVKERVTEEGTKFSQTIATGTNSRNLFFETDRGVEHSVSAYSVKRFTDMVKTTTEQGYNITSQHYDIGFQKFELKEAVTPEGVDAFDEAVI